MKTLYSKIEFWLATVILVLCLYALVPRSYNLYYGDLYNNVFFFSNISRLVILYTAFIFMNYLVIPRFFDRQDYSRALTYTLFCVTGIFVTFFLADIIDRFSYRPGSIRFQHVFNISFIVTAVSSSIFIAYIFIRKVIENYFRDPVKNKTLRTRIFRDCLIAAPIIFVIFLVFMQEHRTSDFAAFSITILPYAFLLFEMNIYWLLPDADNKKNSSLLLGVKMVMFSMVLYAPFGCMFISMISNLQAGPFAVIWLCCFIIITPLSRYTYNRNKLHFLELLTLKKELKTTSSTLQFLRSQINPHFLFNALNTLYGTALQEKSDRTAQGIQKLGDMMRFMLHENNQDKILVGREIDYIRNYIELQLLRTQTSPDILVETEISDTLDNQYIAPMILIPFIENAFKHGISLTHKSWIKITLHTENNKLYFDVHNSVHQHPGMDPEKDKSGIGLENVRQRLELIYPDKHELIIRETPQEFFIHLTLDL